MPRTSAHAGLLLAAALAAGACGPRAPAGPARRVILITCDTLRPDHLTVYGYPRPTSPHLAEFAADAVVFESAWSTAPMTCPAIGSALTGWMPDEIGMTSGNRSLLPAEVETLPEILERRGILTAAVVSNWVLRKPPPEQAGAGFPQGFASFDDAIREKEENRDFFERNGEDTTDAAIAWLSARTARRSTPFFLWVHYQDPHGPYTPPEPWASRFASTPPAGEPELPIGESQSGLGQIPAYQVVDGERRPSAYRDRYDAEIRAFDEAFGRLLAWLRDNGMLEDSLIVFAADHGESLGEHGYWFCHGENTHADEVRIPLIVRGPRGPRGVRREEIAGLLDVVPTVLEAFGLPPVAGRGTSLLGAQLPPDRAIPQVHVRAGDPNRWSAVTERDRRAVVRGDGPPALYDALRDPGEEHDLSASEPERVRELLERGAAFRAAVPGPRIERALVRGDVANGARGAEGLKKLGYTDGAGKD